MSLPPYQFCQRLTAKLGIGIIMVLTVALGSFHFRPVTAVETQPLAMTPSASTASPTANQQAEPQPQTDAENPRSALLYALLVAEMAWQDGQWDTAARQYLLVAQTTQDEDIARLAASAALQSEELPLALQTALLWAELAPKEPEAQAIAVTLLFKSGGTEESLPFLKKLLTLNEQEQTNFFSLIFMSLEENEQQQFLEVLSELDPDFQIEEARLAWSR